MHGIPPSSTPSVATGPPGNCAYPNSPPFRAQTQRLRNLAEFHASAPPVLFRFIKSWVSKPATFVFVRVMPVVAAPLGSLVARAKRTCESTTKLLHTGGVLLLSGFVAP